jgi:hypothetical protein
VTLHFETNPSAEEFSRRWDGLKRWARSQASELRRRQRANSTIGRDLDSIDNNLQNGDGASMAHAAAARVARALKRKPPAHPGSPDDFERWERFRSEVQELSREFEKRNADLREKEQRLSEEYRERAEQLDSARPPQAKAVTAHLFRTIQVGPVSVRIPVVERDR